MPAVGDALGRGCRALTHLSLARNPGIGDDGVRLLCAALAVAVAGERRGEQGPPDGMAAGSSPAPLSLRCLDLSACSLGAAGVMTLAGCSRLLSRLEDLSLAENSLARVASHTESGAALNGGAEGPTAPGEMLRERECVLWRGCCVV
jgi:hypothetical protein